MKFHSSWKRISLILPMSTVKDLGMIATSRFTSKSEIIRRLIFDEVEKYYKELEQAV